VTELRTGLPDRDQLDGPRSTIVCRVAIVQHPPVVLDLKGSLSRAAQLIAEAAEGGADLVVFPETWLPGYPSWAFGLAGWDDSTGKRAHARLLRNAVTVPGPAVGVLGAMAAEGGVHLVIGVNELDTRTSRGTLYNSLLFIDDAGRLLGVHRKLIPTHAERLVWGQGDASTLKAYETAVGRIGGLICWEHWMPLARFAMHASGEQIHVAAWPDLPEIHHLASRHYAFEGRCFVICAGLYLEVDDIPAELREASASAFDQAESDVLLPGGSAIIGPDGEFVTPPTSGRTIVFGDVDLSRIDGELQSLDTVGHYNRPDLFRLTVDRRARRHVDWIDDDEIEPPPQRPTAKEKA